YTFWHIYLRFSLHLFARDCHILVFFARGAFACQDVQKSYTFWKVSAVSAHFQRKQNPAGKYGQRRSARSRLRRASTGKSWRNSAMTPSITEVSFLILRLPQGSSRISGTGSANPPAKSGTNIQINPMWKTGGQTGNIGLIFPELPFKMDRMGVRTTQQQDREAIT
ncbi:MAG: hypothetical protein HFF98_05610, partial [Oscillibacter sp.]|nr:hypothetical protein [Oscillibacter sp.]